MAKRSLLYTLTSSKEPVKALYETPPIPEFEKNPNKCVSALRYLTGKDFNKLLGSTHEPISVDEYSPEARMEQIKIDILRHYATFVLIIQCALNFSSAQRMGYINRNLEDPHYAKRIKHIVGSLEQLWKSEEENLELIASRYEQTHLTNIVAGLDNYNYRTDPENRFTGDDGIFGILSFPIIGHPGMGKSRTIRKICKLHPPLLFHPNLEGPLQSAYQIPSVVIDVPYNGDLGGLCDNFIQAVSEITEIDYFHFYSISEKNTVQLMTAMANLCTAYSVGVIVLDEIQYLLHAVEKERVWAINFLNDISNKLGVPLVFVGTYETYKLTDKFHLARRYLGQPEPMWNPLPYCALDDEEPYDESWRRFIEGLWQYQYVLTRIDLTEDWNKLLHDKSCGIIDIAQKLFAFALIRAIRSGIEMLTFDLVENVYNDHFAQLDKYLDLIRNKDWQALREETEYKVLSWEEMEKKEDELAKHALKSNTEEESESIENEDSVEDTDE